MSISQVVLIVKKGDAKALDFARKITTWLVSLNVTIYCEQGVDIPSAKQLSGPELISSAELMIVSGGDGTFLHAASLMETQTIPIIGINMGSLGFLTPFTHVTSHSGIEAALEGRLEIRERMRLDAGVFRNGELIFHSIAANDCVINHQNMARLLEINCHVDNMFMTNMKSDGLIISTPMGSTAYALAAGGPVLYPGMDCISIVPICPHQLTQRPMVIPAASCLRVELKNDGYITIDGQRGLPVRSGDELHVSHSALPLQVILPQDYSIFNVLRHKLSWGIRESTNA